MAVTNDHHDLPFQRMFSQNNFATFNLCNLPIRLKGKNKSVPMFYCLLWIKISNIRAEDYLLDWIARTVSYIMKRI